MALCQQVFLGFYVWDNYSRRLEEEKNSPKIRISFCFVISVYFHLFPNLLQWFIAPLWDSLWHWKTHHKSLTAVCNLKWTVSPDLLDISWSPGYPLISWPKLQGTTGYPERYQPPKTLYFITLQKIAFKSFQIMIFFLNELQKRILHDFEARKGVAWWSCHLKYVNTWESCGSKCVTTFTYSWRHLLWTAHFSCNALSASKSCKLFFYTKCQKKCF